LLNVAVKALVGLTYTVWVGVTDVTVGGAEAFWVPKKNP
jgi:hypothetical protein